MHPLFIVLGIIFVPTWIFLITLVVGYIIEWATIGQNRIFRAAVYMAVVLPLFIGGVLGLLLGAVGLFGYGFGFGAFPK